MLIFFQYICLRVDNLGFVFGWCFLLGLLSDKGIKEAFGRTTLKDRDATALVSLEHPLIVGSGSYFFLSQFVVKSRPLAPTRTWTTCGPEGSVFLVVATRPKVNPIRLRFLIRHPALLDNPLMFPPITIF